MTIFRGQHAVASLLAALSLSMGLAAQAEEVSIATEGAYPPFNQTEADGSFSGFEIELGNALCQKAALDCKWVKQDFGGMIPALTSGKFDMIFSAMSITPEREKVATFSVPYLNDGFRFYAAKGAAFDEALDGAKIGVLTGSSGEAFVRSAFPKAKTVGYADMDQVNADLEAGRIAYGFNAQLPVQGFLSGAEGADFGFVGPIYTDAALGKGMGAMFRPGSADLKAKFDAAITAAYADGTFKALSEKYFGNGVDIGAEALW